MKNNLVTIFILLAAVGCIVYYLVVVRNDSTLDQAQKHETAGATQQACVLYTATAFNTAPTLNIPNVNRSKILSPEALKKSITTYFAWLTTPQHHLAKNFSAALGGIARCSETYASVNKLSEPVVTTFTPESFYTEWNRTFFDPTVHPDPSQADIASGNYFRNISLLTINSSLSYTYELNLINTTTHRGTKCILYPEGSVRLYTLPGKHLLLCRSTVTFPSGEIWQSDVTPLTISIPPKASLVTTTLRTHVTRR